MVTKNGNYQKSNSNLFHYGEYDSYPEFPKARALQYSKERGQAYLLCSGWVQELPCRYGRHTLL